MGHTVVAQGATDVDGRLSLAVPLGEYLVTARAVEGLDRTSGSCAGLCRGQGKVGALVLIPYDTGIR